LTMARAAVRAVGKILSSCLISFSRIYSFSRVASFWGMKVTSCPLPLLWSLKVNFRSFTSAGANFKTSPIFIPYRAINSRINVFLGLDRR
jgi:hypothetical protein